MSIQGSNTNDGTVIIMRKTNVLAVAAIGLIAVVIVCITVLVGLGRDVTTLIVPLSPIIVTVAGFVINLIKTNDVADQVTAVNDKVDTVVSATNGALDTKLNANAQDVKDHVTTTVQNMPTVSVASPPSLASVEAPVAAAEPVSESVVSADTQAASPSVTEAASAAAQAASQPIAVPTAEQLAQAIHVN